MNSIKIKLLLISIIFFASCLRLYRLDNTPLSVNLDEASEAYDSYSILKTGRDQFGQSFPLAFRSTNDYKLPSYIYSLVPFISVFGLNAFTVRLPSAIFGIVAIFATYYLVITIFHSKKYRYRLGLITALLFSFSPWHLQFSRLGVEINMATTINILAVLFFVKSFKKPHFFILSGFFFGLSLFSYHSSRLVSPILLATLFIIFRKSLPPIKYKVIFFVIYASFFMMFLPIAVSRNAQMRFATMNIFNLENKLTESAKEILQDENMGTGFSGKLFHNRRIVIFTYENLKKYLYNYIQHFSPDYFVEGDDNQMYHAPQFGLLYFSDLIFLVIGIALSLKKIKSENIQLILIWLLLSPAASAAVWNKPSSSRSLIIMPTIYIFIGMGILWFYNFIVKKMFFLKYIIFLSFIAISFYSLSSYLHEYHIHLNYEQAQSWFDGKKEAVAYTESVKDKYQKILISNNRTDWQYIHWLFYSQYDPVKYIEIDGGTKSGDFRDNENFDKYEFIRFDEKNVKDGGEILIVGWPEDFKPIFVKFIDNKRDLVKTLKTVKSIYYPNGKEALRIVSNQWVKQIVVRP